MRRFPPSTGPCHVLDAGIWVPYRGRLIRPSVMDSSNFHNSFPDLFASMLVSMGAVSIGTVPGIEILIRRLPASEGDRDSATRVSLATKSRDSIDLNLNIRLTVLGHIASQCSILGAWPRFEVF
jgi:hypothetical protein